MCRYGLHLPRETALASPPAHWGAGLHRKGASHNSDAVWAVQSFARHAGVGEAAIHDPQKTLDRPERVAANR
jgi:hypothetical protein